MSTAEAEIKILDVRPLSRPQRHVAVFAVFDGLAPGEAFELVNDHDPLGLLHQFHALLPGRFTWDYRRAGPNEWRVAIGRTDAAGAAAPAPAGGCGCGSTEGGGCGG
ncbi:DUF2249 domain-containing protein [Oharaeibacter diazotrophicus]|uniref:Uncharacterized protein (DUF2249 family) n=2 Tax=Oharaeibacter diazotrophicus TaxID=1920512 RepID=A0A4R6RN61_9HYPH|nr:DUF2249 domain-containing protein [Oharaeibacter diazotrophicus]TDP87246.1 uncharacterized protein (DUF2249 family) [Oharaeibacter diazotrophicus]BBE70811.1 hypothetical protein OHA_1_00378 [Pleomorphomonas sp. SM30]GLS77560.1 hypothetical protein GCM10007904_28970 [Oharaeibacter diazotrophicus]